MVAEMGLFSDELLRLLLYCVPLWDNMKPNSPMNRNFLRRNQVLNRRKEACHCKNVTYGMIEDAIRNGANTLQQVMDATGAGKGCGKCKEFLEYLIRDLQDELKK